MATCSVKMMITTCSPMTGHFSLISIFCYQPMLTIAIQDSSKHKWCTPLWVTLKKHRKFYKSIDNPPYRKIWRLVQYPWFLAHENPKTGHKNAQKRSENFKPCIHNCVSTWMNFARIWLSICANGFVRFTRHCGKMYSRHLFPYGGLSNRQPLGWCYSVSIYFPMQE